MIHPVLVELIKHLRDLGHTYGPEAGAFFYAADEVEAAAKLIEIPALGWITWAECGVLATACGWTGDESSSVAMADAVEVFQKTVGLA